MSKEKESKDCTGWNWGGIEAMYYMGVMYVRSEDGSFLDSDGVNFNDVTK